MLYLPPDGPGGMRRARAQSGEPPPNWSRRFAELIASARDSRLCAYYQAGVPAAGTPLEEVPFVALDFETTGLDPVKHGIVSIGAVPFDLRRIRVSQARHWIVKPRRPLVDESITIHGITHSDVREAPDLDVVLTELLDVLAGCIVVVHYRFIERQFLDAALRVRLQEGIQFPVVDTMDLEARIHRRNPIGLLGRLRGRKPASIRLADSRKRYGLPYYQPHHATTDALATAELLQAQVSDRFAAETPIFEIWR